MEISNNKLESFILEKCKLAPLKESSDSDKYLKWLKDEDINQFLESRFDRYSRSSLRSFIKNIIESKNTFFYGIYSLDGIHIGNIKLGPINEHHKFADIGFLIGDKNFYRKGIATEALKKVCNYAFSLGVEKITAGSYENNLASIATLKKVGFSIEGYRSNYVSFKGNRIGVYIFGLNP